MVLNFMVFSVWHGLPKTYIGSLDIDNRQLVEVEKYLFGFNSDDILTRDSSNGFVSYGL